MSKENKSIFRLYPFCIFCYSKLPPSEERTGEGEHVIPEAIFGFWRSYDVCSECIKYFGDSIDHLATKNPQLLNSMKILNLKDVEKHYAQIPFMGEDTISKDKIPMIRRDQNYKTKATISDNFIECSEKDFEFVVINNLRKQLISKLPFDLLERELKELKAQYDSLKPGESFRHQLFGEFRKRQVSNVQYNFENIPSIILLIAKIAFTAIHYLLTPNDLSKFVYYNEYRDQARNNIPLPEHIINSCVLQKNNKRFPFHCIRILAGGLSILVDVMFFGYDNWRCVLPFTEEIKILYNDVQVEILEYYLDFSDLGNREKYLICTPFNGEKFMVKFEG